MAGPLSGIGGQQQIPAANTFKPGETSNGNSTQVREQNNAPAQENVLRSQNTEAAQTQGTETNNQDILEQQLSKALEGNSAEDLSDQPRGSIIDIAV